jgi:glycosyltransferase involved in cell wall biosynthesis
MGMSKLTVVIPVYNSEKFIEETVLSVLNQNLSELEIIIINDGSDDRSGEIIDFMASKYQEISVFHQKNKGLSTSRNVGIDLSKSKYIYFLDSDDVLIKESLEKMISLAESTNSDIVHFTSYSIDADGNLKSRSKIKQYHQHLPIKGYELLYKLFSSENYQTNVQKYIFRRQFLIDENLRFDDGFIHEDEAFTIEALSLAKSATSIGEPLLKKRFRKGSIMSSPKNEKNIEGYAKAVTRLLDFLEEHPVNKKTEYIIRKKIRQLTRRCITLLYAINELDKGNRKMKYFLKNKYIVKAGWDLYVKSKLYGPYQRIKKNLSCFS